MCLVPPWLFNIYMDGVIREVNARMLGTGLSLVNSGDSGMMRVDDKSTNRMIRSRIIQLWFQIRLKIVSVSGRIWMSV